MRLALALALLSPFARGTTYVVDVNNGPGTNFTQITSAIAAASAGDTLLVMPGIYTGFTLDKSLAVIGRIPGSPPSAQWATITNLPAGSTTVIANLDALGAAGFTLTNNAGSVIIDDALSLRRVVVTNCADVRFRGLDSDTDGMLCTNSRVEVADSLLHGSTGSSCVCCDWPQTGSPGHPGLDVVGAEVHLARTTVIGGQGGPSTCGDIGLCDGDGGIGGPGIRIQSGGRVMIAGSSQDFVQAGLGGIAHCVGGSYGPSGPALTMAAGCEVRTSGVPFVGAVITGGGTLVEADPADPTMFALGAPQAGTILTLRVSGPVGAMVDVVLGRRPTLMSTPGLDGEPLCPVNRIFHLGPMPANGTISLNYPVAPGWQPGFSVVFQGILTLPDTSVRYTNSVPAIVQ